MGSSSLEGTVVAGRYRLVKRVSKGRTGDVYEAQHPSLGVRYAVKVLGEELSNDEAAIKRLKHEAQIISKLDHPNIVSVVDFGNAPDGRFYMVMEYVHGKSLRRELRSFDPSLMPLKRGLLILKQLCNALTMAHDAGVIHRNIKVSNLLLAKARSGDEQVKIVDFGVAKVISRRRRNEVTQDRPILGTPAYMSPEMLTGAPVDTRADIFSVGVLAYRMLTGDLPYVGKNPMQVLVAQQRGQAPQLSLVRPENEHKVPADLETILMQCLETDRENRPNHISELTEAILSSLIRVPDDPEARPATITRAQGSLDEAELWKEGSTSEIDIEELEKTYPPPVPTQQKLSQLPKAQAKNEVWNLVNRKAMELAQLLVKRGLGSAELRDYLSATAALEEREMSCETEIALLKEGLDEVDVHWRDKAAALRDAVLNMRLAQGRLQEDAESNEVVILTLDNQIHDLETRMKAIITDAEGQLRDMEQTLKTRQVDLDAVQQKLGENQLIILQLLRFSKPPKAPADVAQSYNVLESMLKHV